MTQQYPQVSPPPPTQKNWFVRHKILTALGVILILIIVGAIASSGGGGTNTATPTSNPPTSQPASQPTPSQKTSQAASGPTDVFPMQDGDWRLDSLRLKDDGVGDFSGSARITYTGSDQNGGNNIFTITVFKNGKDIAALEGSANSVKPGKTVTVALISQDKFVAGPYKYAFQNNL